MRKVEPYGAPDWDAWLHVPEIDTLDAVCLSMNICPQDASEDYGILDAMRGDEDEGLGGPRVADISAAATFQKRMFATRHYGKRVALVEFVNFAHKLGWEMPLPLVQLATLPKSAAPASDELDRIAAVPVSVERSPEEPVAGTKVPSFGPIENETRSHVDTECAAFWLNRKEQTLRAWASKENGPIRPIKVNGRNAWAVADIKRILSRR